MSEAVQFTFDAKGRPVGVIIPIRQWKRIAATLEQRKGSGRTASVLRSIRTGLKQAAQIRRGTLKPITVAELLNEL
jgi:SH3-like domain-containing protein